jgi:hypothetical protein
MYLPLCGPFTGFREPRERFIFLKIFARVDMFPED